MNTKNSLIQYQTQVKDSSPWKKRLARGFLIQSIANFVMMAHSSVYVAVMNFRFLPPMIHLAVLEFEPMVILCLNVLYVIVCFIAMRMIVAGRPENVGASKRLTFLARAFLSVNLVTDVSFNVVNYFWPSREDLLARVIVMAIAVVPAVIICVLMAVVFERNFRAIGVRYLAIEYCALSAMWILCILTNLMLFMYWSYAFMNQMSYGMATYYLKIASAYGFAVLILHGWATVFFGRSWIAGMRMTYGISSDRLVKN